MRLVNKWYFSPDHVRIDFLVNKFIIKLYGGGIIPGVGIDHAFRTGPVNGTQAHGTRFATGINFAAIQLKSIQLLACLSYGNHLGMGRRVIARRDHINTLGDYLCVEHDDAPKRSAVALLHSLSRKLNGPLKKPIFIVLSHVAVIA